MADKNKILFLMYWLYAVLIDYFQLFDLNLLSWCICVCDFEFSDQVPLYLVLLIVYPQSRGDGQKIWPGTHRETA